MTKIEKLTPEQEALLPRFRAEWHAIGTSTARADRTKAEAAILAMRAEIGVTKRPVFIWCESPATSLLALETIKSPQWKKQIASLPGAMEKELGDSLRDGLGDGLGASLGDGLGASLRASLGASLRASLGASLGASLRASLGDSLRDGLGDGLGASLRASLGASLRASLRASLGASLGDSLWASLWDSLRDGLGNAWWGQHEAYWVAFFLFCRDILGVKYDNKRSRQLDMWRDLAQSCCWWWCYENYVVISERPTVVAMDERERIHSASGPAIVFADGWQVHAWHGIRVAKQIIEAPATITPAQIDAETNAEIRRVMLTRFGAEMYIRESGAQMVAKDDVGELYRKQLVDDEPLVMVRVLNSTAEPDGSRKEYWLRVAPDLRSLWPGVGPASQELTPRNAIASTCGLSGDEYWPAQET